MKKWLSGFVCLFALLTGSLRAQEISGTWQGTLKAGKDLRVVVKFSKDDGGGWKGDFYSIDQGGQALALSKIVAKDGAIKFSIPQLGGEFAGTVSGESAGATIAGNWSQGPNALPLVLTRAKPGTEWSIPEPEAKIAPMAADAKPTFEVATIKPSKPDQQGKGFMVRGRRFSTINTSLVDLIAFSYDLQQKEILSLPAWASTQMYDLDAQPDLPGTPSQKQLKGMVQKLLAERFKLTYHHEKKELSVYAITIAKGGPKLTKSQSEGQGLPGLFFRGLGNMVNTNATITDFAGVMQAAVLDRPVVDQTGLTAHYDFTLNWTPDESQFGGMGIKVPPPSDKADAPPGLFTAIQEQLGLRLDATKAPVDAFVVDHVEMPSAN